MSVFDTAFLEVMLLYTGLQEYRGKLLNRGALSVRVEFFLKSWLNFSSQYRVDICHDARKDVPKTLLLDFTGAMKLFLTVALFCLSRPAANVYGGLKLTDADEQYLCKHFHIQKSVTNYELSDFSL